MSVPQLNPGPLSVPVRYSVLALAAAMPSIGVKAEPRSARSVMAPVDESTWKMRDQDPWKVPSTRKSEGWVAEVVTVEARRRAATSRQACAAQIEVRALDADSFGCDSRFPAWLLAKSCASTSGDNHPKSRKTLEDRAFHACNVLHTRVIFSHSFCGRMR